LFLNYLKKLFSNPNAKTINPKDAIKTVGPQVPTPSSRVAGVKKEGIKFPAQKTSEVQPKFRMKTEENPLPENKHENLSLSFLLDQNVSVDSISAPMVSSSMAKEMENELKKKASSSISTGSTSIGKIDPRKSVNGPMTSKNVSDSAKPKPKVAINTSPIPVKKKTPSENNKN